MSTFPITEILSRSEKLIERETIDSAIARLADEIATDYLQPTPMSVGHTDTRSAMPVYLTLMQGGLPFAGQLALELGSRQIDLQFDFLHATRYRGATTGGELRWQYQPATPLTDRHVLLVDDILDEGHTLKQVRDWCVAQRAADVRIATLAIKMHDRRVSDLHADYAGLSVPDRYVFGFGMDYHEQGRNLPDIYAIKE